MNEKFTPGPWFIDAGPFIIRVIFDKEKEEPGGYFPPECTICDCGAFESKNWKKYLANANLIAAAPEMYELLDCIRKSVALDAGIMSSCIARIEPLLKKARGGE